MIIEMLSWILLLVSLSWTIESAYYDGEDWVGQIYNYNKHSYIMSSYEIDIYSGYFYCDDVYLYTVDIEDKQENDAIASVIRVNRTLGIYRAYGNADLFLREHTYEIIKYSNWDPNDPAPSKWNGVQMMASTGFWRVANEDSRGYWICEDDYISPNGVNITSSKIINIPYDNMVSFRGHTYYIYKAFRDYGTSRQICHSQHNGYLFIPNDGFENCAVHEIIFGQSFVGITNLGHNRFLTEKNYLTTYLPWSSLNKTDKECVMRSYINGEFTTEDCSKGGHIICETDSVITGATPTTCNEKHKYNYFSQIFYFQNNSFYVFDFLSSREQAISICKQRKSSLYAPFNSVENCAVLENVEFDIGINYGSVHLKHTLMRGDKLSSNFTNWDENYPNSVRTKGCVYAQYASGKWRNDYCHNTRFICYKNDDDYSYSNIDCKNRFFHWKNQTYSIKLNGKFYTIFGKTLTFHDSVRLCSQLSQSLIQTDSKYIINKINEEIKDEQFFIGYRILWNGTLKWMGDVPANTPWAANEPKYNDEEIACIVVSEKGEWITTSCRNEHMAVCVGNNSPNSSASTSGSTSTKLGVGIFFGILAAIGVIAGALFYIKRKNISLNISRSFGSFRRRT